jgi:hypothetical protein
MGFLVLGLHKGSVHHKSMIQGFNDKVWWIWWIHRKTQREYARNELQEGKLYYIVEKNYIKNEDEFRDGLRELLGIAWKSEAKFLGVIWTKVLTDFTPPPPSRVKVVGNWFEM